MTYHTIEELRALSLDELRALWELVPTDRQHRYQTVYQREVRTNGASGADALEQQVVSALIQRYETGALVPIGARWARTPARIQEAVKAGESLIPPEAEFTPPTTHRAQIVLILGGAALCLVIFGVLLISRRGGDVAQPPGGGSRVTPRPRCATPPPPRRSRSKSRMSSSATGCATAPPPTRSTCKSCPPGRPSRASSSCSGARWTSPSGSTTPTPTPRRSFTALSVRPVMGVPWSPQNEALFQALGPGATFSLRLNTGAVQQFEFASQTEVSRSDTSAFRQIEPGLVLVLIGERDARGAPTATRLLVLATYPPEQELSRDDVLAVRVELPVVEETPTPPAPPRRRSRRATCCTWT